MENARETKVVLHDKGDKRHFIPGISVDGVLREVRHYRSAFDLLETETVLPELEEDFETFLRCFDDYEEVEYFCLNGEIVIFCDSCGNIISAKKIENILPMLRETYEEENA